MLLDVDLKSLVGSQTVPYIYEDYTTNENIKNAIMKFYNFDAGERDKLKQKVLNYVNEEFSYQNTIDMWHETMIDVIEKFKDKKHWTIKTY